MLFKYFLEKNIKVIYNFHISIYVIEKLIYIFFFLQLLQ